MFIMYELKTDLIISNYTKEQEQITISNVLIKNKTKHKKPSFPAPTPSESIMIWEDLTKSRPHCLST